ncbi:MAG: hypothetical protein R3C18_09615 [Planctomycetaceae bacterium]
MNESGATIPPLTWWQAAWRALLWLVGIILTSIVASEIDHTGGLGTILTFVLLVVSALVHQSFKVPVIIGLFVVAGFFFIVSMFASGLTRFR